MKKLSSLLLLAVMLCATQCLHADEAAVKKAIVGKYQIYKEALENANIDDLMAETTSDFTVKTTKGKIYNRAQFIESQRQLFEHISTVNKVEVRIHKCTVGNQRVLVSITTYVDFEVKDAQGKSHRLTEETLSNDLWVPVQGSWKCKRSENLRTKATIDGKAIQ